MMCIQSEEVWNMAKHETINDKKYELVLLVGGPNGDDLTLIPGNTSDTLEVRGLLPEHILFKDNHQSLRVFECVGTIVKELDDGEQLQFVENTGEGSTDR